MARKIKTELLLETKLAATELQSLKKAGADLSKALGVGQIAAEFKQVAAALREMRVSLTQIKGMGGLSAQAIERAGVQALTGRGGVRYRGPGGGFISSAEAQSHGLLGSIHDQAMAAAGLRPTSAGRYQGAGGRFVPAAAAQERVRESLMQMGLGGLDALGLARTGIRAVHTGRGLRYMAGGRFISGGEAEMIASRRFLPESAGGLPGSVGPGGMWTSTARPGTPGPLSPRPLVPPLALPSGPRPLVLPAWAGPSAGAEDVVAGVRTAGGGPALHTWPGFADRRYRELMGTAPRFWSWPAGDPAFAASPLRANLRPDSVGFVGRRGRSVGEHAAAAYLRSRGIDPNDPRVGAVVPEVSAAGAAAFGMLGFGPAGMSLNAASLGAAWTGAGGAVLSVPPPPPPPRQQLTVVGQGQSIGPYAAAAYLRSRGIGPEYVAAGRQLRRMAIGTWFGAAGMGFGAAGNIAGSAFSGPAGVGSMVGSTGTLLGMGALGVPLALAGGMFGAKIGGIAGLPAGPWTSALMSGAGMVLGGAIGSGLGSIAGKGAQIIINQAQQGLRAQQMFAQYAASGGIGLAGNADAIRNVMRARFGGGAWVTPGDQVANQAGSIATFGQNMGFGIEESLGLGRAATLSGGGSLGAFGSATDQQTALALQRAYGLGPDVAGGFIYGSRRGSLRARGIPSRTPGGTGDYGNYVSRMSQGLGLGMGEHLDFMQFVSGEGRRGAMTGRRLNLTSFYGQASMAGADLTGLAFARGMRGYGEQLSQAGPGDAMDVFAMLTLGGLGTGPITPGKLAGALQRIDEGNFTTAGMQSFGRGISALGGGSSDLAKILYTQFARRRGIAGSQRQGYAQFQALMSGGGPALLPAGEDAFSRAQGTTPTDVRNLAELENMIVAQGLETANVMKAFADAAKAMKDQMLAATPQLIKMATLIEKWAR